MAADNLGWIAGNAKDGAVAMLGLDSNVEVPQVAHTAVAQAQVQGQVAGAYTTRLPEKQSGFSVDALLTALGIE